VLHDLLLFFCKPLSESIHILRKYPFHFATLAALKRPVLYKTATRPITKKQAIQYSFNVLLTDIRDFILPGWDKAKGEPTQNLGFLVFAFFFFLVQ